MRTVLVVHLDGYLAASGLPKARQQGPPVFLRWLTALATPWRGKPKILEAKAADLLASPKFHFCCWSPCFGWHPLTLAMWPSSSAQGSALVYYQHWRTWRKYGVDMKLIVHPGFSVHQCRWQQCWGNRTQRGSINHLVEFAIIVPDFGGSACHLSV